METIHEKTALQNFADNFDLEIKIFIEEDKRKKDSFILLTKKGLIVSPKLNYDKMNHLLLGVNNCKKYNL